MKRRSLEVGRVYFSSSTNRFSMYHGVHDDGSFMFSQAEFYEDSKTCIIVERFGSSYLLSLCDISPDKKYGFIEHELSSNHKAISVNSEMTLNKRIVLVEKIPNKLGEFEMSFPEMELNEMIGARIGAGREHR